MEALRTVAPNLKSPPEPPFRGAGTVVGCISEVRITRAPAGALIL